MQPSCASCAEHGEGPRARAAEWAAAEAGGAALAHAQVLAAQEERVALGVQAHAAQVRLAVPLLPVQAPAVLAPLLLRPPAGSLLRLAVQRRQPPPLPLRLLKPPATPGTGAVLLPLLRVHVHTDQQQTHDQHSFRSFTRPTSPTFIAQQIFSMIVSRQEHSC